MSQFPIDPLSPQITLTPLPWSTHCTVLELQEQHHGQRHCLDPLKSVSAFQTNLFTGAVGLVADTNNEQRFAFSLDGGRSNQLKIAGQEGRLDFLPSLF